MTAVPSPQGRGPNDSQQFKGEGASIVWADNGPPSSILREPQDTALSSLEQSTSR
jgi:hypothetical protein